MTTDELSKVEARYQRATAKAEQVRQERAALISQALAEGWTHAKIARATGLTRGRIGQMAGAIEPLSPRDRQESARRSRRAERQQ